jgi:hypothetical protein
VSSIKDQFPPLDLPLNSRERAPVRKPKHKPKEWHQASRFIPPDYFERTVVCFASGPSLTPEVIETIRPYHEAGKVAAMGLGDTYRAVPYLDEFYACDRSWWNHHTKHKHMAHGRDVMDYPCRLWGNQSAWSTLRRFPHVNIVQGFGKKGFSPNRKAIHYGNNSGFQLLNLAYWLTGGKGRFILVGYDMRVPKDGLRHFFGDHGEGLSKGGNYTKFNRQFEGIAAEQRRLFVNCTPGSALTAFPFGNLSDELEKA